MKSVRSKVRNKVWDHAHIQVSPEVSFPAWKPVKWKVYQKIFNSIEDQIWHQIKCQLIFTTPRQSAADRMISRALVTFWSRGGP